MKKMKYDGIENRDGSQQGMQATKEISGARKALTQEQIDAWKKEYGRIFRSVIGKNTIIWRRVKRSEYVSAMTDEGLSDDPEVRIYQRQERILKSVCLYPDNVDELIQTEGCLATNLGGEIMDRSGFAPIDTSEI